MDKPYKCFHKNNENCSSSDLGKSNVLWYFYIWGYQTDGWNVWFSHSKVVMQTSNESNQAMINKWRGEYGGTISV